MPPKDQKMSFMATSKTVKIQNVLYADLEASLTKMNENKGNKTYLTHKHEPNSFCLLWVSSDNPSDFEMDYEVDDGTEIMANFLIAIRKRAANIQKIRMARSMIPLNCQDFESMDRSEGCLCKKELHQFDAAHRHHNHDTGKSIG